MNILVTGACGFIGSHLSETLLKSGHSVFAVDNFNEFYSPALKHANHEAIRQTARQAGAAFQCYTGDITDAPLIEKILKAHSIEVIIHLAAMAGVRPSLQNPVLYEKVNGLGTAVLLEEARKAGIRHFVFGSSSSVYGLNSKVPFAETDPVDKPFSPYAATKRANELSCKVYSQVYGMDFALLRFFTVYGPRQRPDLAIRKFTQLIDEGKEIPIFGDGSFRRDFTYVDDIVGGILRSLDWVLKKEASPKCEAFNLGESATTTVLRMIELIEEALGKKANRVFHPAQPGDVPVTYADLKKSKTILGYNPTTPIEAGIPKFIEWYKNQS